MLLETLSQKLRKAKSANATDTSFPARIPRATEPTTGTIPLGGTGAASQNAAVILPYGTGSNNHTFSFRVIGWRLLDETGAQPPTSIWIPVILGEFSVTLSSTYLGLAGKQIVATEFFADTITITYPSTAPGSIEIISPANDAGIASVTMDVKGFQKLELIFNINSGSTTDMNALVALI